MKPERVLNWKTAFQRLRRWNHMLALAFCSFIAIAPASPAAQLTIGIIGDYGAAYAGGASFSNEQAVANLVKSWNPNFIITTGDNNYPNGEASNIDTNIGQFFHEFIYPYVGTFGAGATSKRFWPSIGNHEWPNGVYQLVSYLDYFTLPGNERYYNYREGPLEIFAVVSDQQEPDGALPVSTQSLWLSNALAVSTAPWRVVYFHESPYSSGSAHGSYTHQADNMLWPFTAWGASAIFAGHNHHYERILTNGLNYITIGLGGDRIDTFHLPLLAGSLAQYNATYGAGQLTVTETNLLFQFINTTNKVIDSFVLEKLPARLGVTWANSKPQIQLTGSPGANYIVQAGRNLIDWTPISTNTGMIGPTNVLDAGFVNQPTRFYRAVNGR